MNGVYEDTVRKISARKEIIQQLNEENDLKNRQIMVNQHHIGVMENEIKEFEQMLTSLTKKAGA